MNKDNYIDMMELKLMMEKLGQPQTHLGLKNMMKEVDEDLDSRLSFREVRAALDQNLCVCEEVLSEADVLHALLLHQFLLIFRKAAAGELADSGLCALAGLFEIDVSSEGVKGAKTFFEAKVGEAFSCRRTSLPQQPTHTSPGLRSRLSVPHLVSAQVHAVSASSRFEEEIRQEQELRKKEAEEQKKRQAAFREKQSAFK